MALTKIDDRGITYPLDLIDNEKIRLGTGNDLEIYHDGTHSYINDTGTGNLKIKSNKTAIQSTAGEDCIVVNENGAVELYYDDSKKLETDASGVKVSNGRFYSAGTFAYIESSDTSNATLTLKKTAGGADSIDYLQLRDSSNNVKLVISGSGDIDIEDNAKLKIGTGDDLQIYHDGSNSYIANATNNLWITGSGDGDNNNILIRPKSTENSIKATGNGNVELYYDNSKKFETTSTGSQFLGQSGSHTDVTILGYEGQDANLNLYADEGDDNADKYRILSSTDGSFYLQNYTAGSWEWNLKATGNAGVELYYDNSKKLETTNSGITVTGNYATTGWIDIDSDSSRFRCGDGQDLEIWHDGSGSQINNSTGYLVIQSDDLRLRDKANGHPYLKAVADGAVELYYDNSKKLETHATNGVQFPGGLQTPDTQAIRVGNSNDLLIYHDGSDSYIKDSGTGKLRLLTDSFRVSNAADSENLIAGEENGGVDLFYDDSKKLETKSYGLSLHGNVLMTNTDNQQLKLGAGNDLVIYHDGSNSYVNNTNASAHLVIQSAKGVHIKHDGEDMIKGIADGAVELYYDNSKKLETFANGIKLYDTQGDLIGEGFDGGFNFTSSVMVNELRLQDNENIKVGLGEDLQIYHDGSNSYINNTTGILRIRDSEIRLCNTDNETYFMGAANGAAKLYYDDSVKFETTTTGVSWGTTRLRCDDNGMIELGTSQDLQIYHNGTNSIIDNNTGWIQILSDNHALKDKDDGDNMIVARHDGAVELYYDGSKRVETQSTGVKFLATDGSTVRGRVDNSAGVIGIEHTVFYPIQVAHNGTDAYWGTLAFAGISGNMNSDGDKAYIQFVSHPRHRGFGSVHMWYGCSGNSTGNTFDWDFTVYNAQANTGYTSNTTTFTITTGSMGNGQLRKFDISSSLPTVAAQDMVKVKIVYDELQGGTQVLLMGMQVTEFTSA